MSVEIVARGRIDIDQAVDNLTDFAGSRSATRFRTRLERTLARLDRFPESAGLVDPPYPKHPGLRVTQVDGFPRHIIYYVPTPDGIRAWGRTAVRSSLLVFGPSG